MTLLDTVKSVLGPIYGVSRGYSTGDDGIDLPAPEGTPIYAVASGTVEYAKDASRDSNCKSAWACGGGNVVNINIGGNRATQYAHLSRSVVSSGQSVTRGQLIGYVGHTGDATGNHLHFGLWDKTINRIINPQSFLESAGSLASAPKDGDPLFAWPTPDHPDGIISFPRGHIITSADTRTILDALDKAGFFSDSLGVLAGSKADVYNVLRHQIGKPWNEATLTDIGSQIGLKAIEAKPGGIGVPDVAGAIAGIGTTLVTTVAYVLAVVIIVVGLFIYSKSNPQAEAPVG